MAAGRTWLVPALAFGGVAALAVSAMLPRPVEAKNRFALEPPNVEQKRAYKYAAMSGADCLKELDRRKVPYKLEPPTKQVDTPLRFTGPIRGVAFKLTKRAEENPDPVSPAAVADCRLALAIDDMAQVLAKRKVKTVEYLSMYRKRGVGFIRPGKRHPAGLAIDVATITTRGAPVDGTEPAPKDTTYSVYGDWHPSRVGGTTCGPKATKPRKNTPGARFLRDVVCELADQGSFNLLLTPHYDWGHRDHFHMEVRTGIRWFLIQ